MVNLFECLQMHMYMFYTHFELGCACMFLGKCYVVVQSRVAILSSSNGVSYSSHSSNNGTC